MGFHDRKASQSGSGAPTAVTPDYIGQVYVDTDTNQKYISYGTSAGEFHESADVSASASGSRIAILDKAITPANTSTGSWADVSSGLSTTFDVDAAGLFNITLSMSAYSDGGTTACRTWFRLMIDEGESNEQLVGGSGAWKFVIDPNQTERKSKTFHGAATLSAGSHTISVQWQQFDGNGAMGANGDDTCQLIATLVTGSGAGGMLADEASIAGSQTISTVFSTYGDGQDIAGAGVTVDTVDGETILVRVSVAAYGTVGAATGFANIELDGVSVGPLLQEAIGSSGNATITDVIPIAPATAGSHIITMIASKPGGNNWTVSGGFLSVWRMRGGLVPIRQNGVDVLDKPAALDFLNMEVTDVGGVAKIRNLPDTKPFVGIWLSGGVTMSFGPNPSALSNTVWLTLQDNAQRSLDVSTPAAWAVANGVDDLGYDEAASQGNSKWLYFYAVPDSGDDTLLTIVASDNVPSVGPAGYTEYRAVCSAYMESGAILSQFKQEGNKFLFAVKMIGYSSGGSVAAFSDTSMDVSAAVPPTATSAICHLNLGTDTTNGYQYWVGGVNPVDSTYVQLDETGYEESETNESIVPIFVSQTLYHKLVLLTGSGNAQVAAMRIHGYVDGSIEL